jgi:hypothetical protein
VRADIDHRAVVMLSVDLDQRRAQRLQDLHADRLVVDEGARAPVGQLHAAQDQAVFRRDPVLAQQRKHGMVGLDVERRRHLPLLGALPHQARVAAAPERQRERIEQDRLAGAGLAGQHRQPGRIVDVEPFDQDDVADGQAGEHRQSIRHARRYAGHSRLAVIPIFKDVDGRDKPGHDAFKSCGVPD